MKVFSSFTPPRSLASTTNGLPEPSLPDWTNLKVLVWFGKSLLPRVINPDLAKYLWFGVYWNSSTGFCSAVKALRSFASITFAPLALISKTSTSFCNTNFSAPSIEPTFVVGAAVAVLVAPEICVGTSNLLAVPVLSAAAGAATGAVANIDGLPSWTCQLLYSMRPDSENTAQRIVFLKSICIHLNDWDVCFTAGS